MNEYIPENNSPVNQVAKQLLGEEASPESLYLLQLARLGLERLADPIEAEDVVMQLEEVPPKQAMLLIGDDLEIEGLEPEEAQLQTLLHLLEVMDSN